MNVNVVNAKSKSTNFKPIEKNEFINNPDIKNAIKEKAHKMGLPAVVEISDYGKEVYDSVFGSDIFVKSYAIFSGGKEDDLAIFPDRGDLVERVAKDYETRYNHIKDLIAKNPELKAQEQDLIRRLDEHYESVFEIHGDKLAGALEGIEQNYNNFKQFVGEEFKVAYPIKAAKKLDHDTRENIKNEFTDFFKQVTSKIKDGVSSHDIGEINLSNNRFINKFSDIQNIYTMYNHSSKLTLHAEEIAIRNAADGESPKQELDALKELVNKFYKQINGLNFNSNDYLKDFTKNSLNFNDFFSTIENKLYKHA